MELKFGDKLNGILHNFIAQKVKDQGSKGHVSLIEKHVVKMSKTLDVREMLIYAHFVSYVEVLKNDVQGILIDLIKYSENV